MRRSVFLVLIAFALLQLSSCILTKVAVNNCLQSECKKFNCVGKIDEYACKIATNAYYNYFKQPDCVEFLEHFIEETTEIEFPMHFWVPCRYIAYNVHSMSPTMAQFLDCQDVCIDKSEE